MKFFNSWGMYPQIKSKKFTFNTKDNIKDILKDIDVSYSTGITKKASRKEEMIACREVHYIFSILTKRGINNDYRNEI